MVSYIKLNILIYHEYNDDGETFVYLLGATILEKANYIPKVCTYWLAWYLRRNWLTGWIYTWWICQRFIILIVYVISEFWILWCTMSVVVKFKCFVSSNVPRLLYRKIIQVLFWPISPVTSIWSVKDFDTSGGRNRELPWMEPTLILQFIDV